MRRLSALLFLAASALCAPAPAFAAVATPPSPPVLPAPLPDPVAEATAPEAFAARLDSAFPDATGAALALVRDGEIVFARGRGLADRARGTTVAPDTVFRAGSIGKSVVGVAVMLLVEEGRLSLDDTLASRAPGIAFDNPWEASEPIRLVHLLEHTTGWADLSPREFALDDAGMSLLDGIAAGGTRRSRYPPGRYHAYSGAGHAIAAHIVAQAAGMPFDRFAAERIFAPLGMATATYGPVDGMARSYQADGRETPYQHYPLYPSGGLNLSVADLAKFAAFLAGDGRPLLRPESLRRLWQPESTLAARAGVRTGYGLGVVSLAGRSKVLVGHGGAIGSYQAIYRAAPGQRIGYALMAGTEALPADLLQALDAWLGDDIATTAPVAVPAASIAMFAGTYQPIAQRNRLTALPDSLSVFLPVSIDGDTLRIGGREAWALDGGLVRYTDRAVPTQALVDTGDGRELLGATAGYRRVSRASIAAKAAYGIVFALGLASAFGLVLVQALRGRRAAPAGAAALAYLPLLALAGVLAAAASMPDPVAIARFGTAGPLSIAVFVLTLLVPAGALLALVSAVRARDGSRFARATALVAGGVVAIAAVYLARFEWIGLRTWALAG